MLARLIKASKEKDQGFTLIELLVVIVIIGILAAIAIPLFLKQQEKGVDAGVKSDLKAAATLMETYYVENGSYPTAISGIAGDLKKTGENDIAVATANSAEGFCLKGSNPDGSRKGGATAGDAAFFWYDSGAGGLATGTTKPTGACTA